jgi:N-acetylglucosamine-6-phosphate deacetylase
VTARRLGVARALVGGALVDGDVAVEGDQIAAVGLPPAAGERIAAPGLVDAQVNGFAGIDLMVASEEEVHQVSRALTRYGVTAWLPTLITAAAADTDRALEVFAKVLAAGPPAGAARPLGVHLEGPYLSPQRLGTHPAAHRRDPDAEEMRGWRRRGPVVAVTLAPELPGALDMIGELAADGVRVFVGHSDATAEQTHAGFDAGAIGVTHLFNATSQLHHRRPGLPGAALARPGVVVGLVVDGYHLADDTVRVVWAAAPGRVVLVTDATAAAGRPDGRYELAGVRLDVRDGAVRNATGSLAGSALTLDTAVRNARALGIDPAAALAAVTEVPAMALGRDDVGRLRVGGPADVVVLSSDLQVKETFVAGRPVDPAT